MILKKGILFTGFLVCSLIGAVYFIFFTSPGAHFVIRSYTHHISQAKSVVIANTTGTLAHGITLKDITISGLNKLPAQSTAKIQETRISCPFFNIPETAITLANGRLQIPQTGLILFYGTLKNGLLDLNIYSKALTIHALPDFLKPQQNMTFVNAEITDLDISIRNTLHKPRITGGFVIKNIRFQNFSGHDIPCDISFDITRDRQGAVIFGDITLKGGKIILPKTTVDIQGGKVVLGGSCEKIALNIGGSSTIGDTIINISLRGTSENPILKLSSTPPLPEEELMVMVLTGSPWEGTREAFAQKKLSPDLVKDFVDYIFFGGSERKLEESLGIRSVSLQFDQGKKGIEIKKGITPATNVIYGIEQNLTNQTSVSTTQSVGLEHKLTETLSIQGEAAITTPSSKTIANQTTTDNKAIQLKIKKEF
ncbi:MAG TPA: translocation/assembly module TamB domain-containing protein [Candidatus Omnitrophota bacterium]|nr:translocation/assembly module TamB domain-containing protein [Candidatus Omnitrophota bacterium]